MIREADMDDAPAIAEIYNGYVLGSTATFDTEPVSVDHMRKRMREILEEFPYFVYVLNGEVAGYCYAHRWKEKEAYRQTLETTVYVAQGHCGRGVGHELMEKLIAECRSRGFWALIACITAGNEASVALHERLGFVRVSMFKNVGMKFGCLLDVNDYELLLDQGEAFSCTSSSE